MLPTPSTSHVNYDRIYEPAEDSYLLLDTLSSPSETALLQRQFPPTTSTPTVLEVGTGSGVVLAFLTAHAGHIFGRPDVATFGTDVNPFACEATTQTVALAVQESSTPEARPATFLASSTAHLVSCFRPQSVDVLVFNPPYVPSEDVPLVSGNDGTSGALSSLDATSRDFSLLALSTDGGAEGMEITNRLLDDMQCVLSRRGVAYVLLCAQNKPDEIMGRIRTWPGGWSAEKVGTSGKKAGWERLCVIRIGRVEASP